MTARELRVYNLLKNIPRGKVTTYGIIAEKLGLNPRDVGRILSKNEHPLEYPCYKVVRSDGRLRGYTINGKNDKSTLKVKANKLLSDGIKLNGGKVNKKFFYKFNR
jgi:O-6-methylguanine DNA methyltransferase